MSGKSFTPATNRIVPVTKSKLKGLLSFGADNLFPQLLTEIVNTSVTAAACCDVKAKFLEGNGFRDTALSERVVHASGLTLDQVLSHTSRNMALGEVVAIHVTYNALGQKVGIRPLDYEIVRLAEPNEEGAIHYAGLCLYLGSTLYRNKANKFTPVNLFNDNPDVVLSEIAAAGGIHNYYGQLLYAFLPGNGDNHYHIPSFFSCVKSMESEAELHDFDYHSIVNGFNNSGLLAFLRGKKDPGYDPFLDPFSIESQIQNSLGPKKTGAVLTYAAESVEELQALDFKSFYGPTIAERYNATNDRVPQHITRGWGVPNELVGIRRTGGVMFSADELKIANQYMQWQVNKPQRFMKLQFERLLSNWAGAQGTPDCTIENLDYFTPKSEATSVQQAG